MVQVYLSEIVTKLKSLQPGKRMPLLCSLNRSFGWRIISENYEEHERGIRSEHCDINQDYLTSMAICDETGIVAVGSGGADGTLYFIKDLSAMKDVESGPRFQTLYIEILGTPIHSLDWNGNNLLVGTVQGNTKLYKIDYTPHFQLQFVADYTNPTSQIIIHAPSYVTNSHVKSVEFAPNYSSDPMHHFLTITKNQISLWNQLHPAAPVRRIQANELPLMCASWSPNDPQSLIVSGGLDKSLTIIDTRVPERDHNGIVWVTPEAHDRPICDAKFNPFIPYWLASAGEDSIVNIWDIRSSYHAPVAKIDGMMGTATSITWSNIRPENLGTTSTDGIMRYWTLSPESLPIWDTLYRLTDFDAQDTLPIPQEFESENIWCTKDNRYKHKSTHTWLTEVDEGHKKSTMLLAGALGLGEWGRPETGTIYKGETVVRAKGSVVSVKSSKLRPSVYYCITSGGQLAAHTVRFDATSNLRNRHRYDPKDKNELAAQIEDDIYCRRITDAQRRLQVLRTTALLDQQAEQHRDEEVGFLEKCLLLPQAIRGTEWAFDSIPDRTNKRVSRRIWNHEDIWDITISLFKTELKYWSYRIPPGYNTAYKFPLEIKEPIAARLIEEELIPKEIPPFINDTDSLNTSILEEVNKPLPPVVVTPVHSPSITERRKLDPVPPITTEPYQPHLNTNPFTPPISATTEEPIKPTYATTNPFLSHSPVEEEETSSVHSKEETGHHLGLTFSRHSEPGESKKHHHMFHNPFKHLTRHVSIKRPEEEQEKERPKLFSANKDGLKRDSSTRRNALHGPF
ncbi:hypothetical protein HPULCUR_006924 [Helicostylum pulchrum]|uniref:Uncharacterized protein n=1 Tax=Helicostylum pulchrum TaxID=562976 RepID=A0ABP9Y3F0_9FUNG